MKCRYFIILLLMCLVVFPALGATGYTTEEKERVYSSQTDYLKVSLTELNALEQDLLKAKEQLTTSKQESAKLKAQLTQLSQESKKLKQEATQYQELLTTARTETEKYKDKNKTLLVFGGIAIGVAVGASLIQIFK